MLEDEVLEIFRNPEDDGSALNDLVDEFRVGRDADEVLSLLDGEDAELIGIGAYILGELAFDRYDSPKFFSRLHSLLAHDDSGVRFSALSAIFPALDLRDPVTRELLGRLRNDPNEGVRRSAERAADALLKTW